MTTPVPQGVVRFESGMNSKLVLDVSTTGQIIQQEQSESSQTQAWRLTPVSDARDLYHIALFNSDDDRVLAAAGRGGLILQSLMSNRSSQRWALRHVSGETYVIENQIENQRDGGVLSVVGESRQPGANVMLAGNVNQQNQRWRLVGSRPRTGMTSLEGLIGGVPLCDWEPITTQVNGIPQTPLIVELYEHALSRYSTWPNGRRGIITRSIRFDDTSRAGGSVATSIGLVSAVVVRPGPDFDSQLIYKVTLFNHLNFEHRQLPLTVGVYPDLHCYAFAETADSILLEQGTSRDFTEPFSAARSYYRSLMT